MIASVLVKANKVFGSRPTIDLHHSHALGNATEKHNAILLNVNAPGAPIASTAENNGQQEGDALKTTIYEHPEFAAFVAGMNAHFALWRDKASRSLRQFKAGAHPKETIVNLAEGLLAHYANRPLIDRYDVYQHLMDYWAATMQDDCYLIAADGWREAAQPRLLVEDKHTKTKAKPDYIVGKAKYQAELIPPGLIVRRWYADEQAAIEKLEADAAALQQQLEEMTEEHGGEEGLLSEALSDKGKLTRASVTARLKEIKGDADAGDEIKVLKAYLALVEQESAAADQLGAAQDTLTQKVAARYSQLTEEEIKTLVVDDKWLAALAAAVQGELDRVSQTLTGRIRELAQRYATPLPQITDEIAALSARVDGHLRKMGAVWK